MQGKDTAFFSFIKIKKQKNTAPAFFGIRVQWFFVEFFILQ
jgi:hypothetical protein